MQAICLDLLGADTPFYMPESFESTLFGVENK